MKRKLKPLRVKLPKATQEQKDKIKQFFDKNPFNKNKICKELKIPPMAIYTATRQDGKNYISHKVACKLLTYIQQWEKL